MEAINHIAFLFVYTYGLTIAYLLIMLFSGFFVLLFLKTGIKKDLNSVKTYFQMETRFKNAVDVVRNISAKEFKRNYLRPNKPVVIKGLWDNYNARKKWTVDFFKNNLGQIQVGVFNGKKQQVDKSFKYPHLEMKFADYLDEIISDKSSDLRLFLFNIFKHNPELRNDFGFPPLTRRYLKKVPFMFFGGKNSVVRLHQDMDWANVFLTQLHGRKEVVLFHPKYSRLLYKYPFGTHSPVDIENPDYDKYPGLKHVKGVHCILEPGDTLFIPSGYWHHIKYLDGGYAINERALNQNPVFWVKGLWNVLFLNALDDLMRFLFSDNWFKRKSKISKEHADVEISKIVMA